MEIITFTNNLQKYKKRGYNRGQAMEHIAKDFYGLRYRRDNVSHKKSGDIKLPNMEISVKSKDCSLDNHKDHKELQKSIERFFMEDVSSHYLYMTENGKKEITGYLLDREEFRKTLENKAKIYIGKEGDKEFRIRLADSNLQTYFAINF